MRCPRPRGAFHCSHARPTRSRNTHSSPLIFHSACPLCRASHRRQRATITASLYPYIPLTSASQIQSPSLERSPRRMIYRIRSRLTFIGLGISEVGNLCWTTELDQQPLGPCAVVPTTPVEPPTAKPALAPPLPSSSVKFARRPSHDWADIDADAATSACDRTGSTTTSRSSFTTSMQQPATPPECFVPDSSHTISASSSGPALIPNPVPSLHAYPYAHALPGPDSSITAPAATAPEDSCAAYLTLLHDIEQSLTNTAPPTSLGARVLPNPTQTVDSVLAINQRHLTTLLRLAEHPRFETALDDAHLICTVTLSKILTLFHLGYADFTMRLDAHDALGCTDRLIRFGVFELNFLEQSAICRSLFLRELKRAQLCLGRLVAVWGRKSAEGYAVGRLEGLLEEMQRRIDFLVAALESEKV
ncbi:hypothetical protein BJX96DRAFT_91634 [Aspergillus floccosus]